MNRSWYYVLYVLNINTILIRIAYCPTLASLIRESMGDVFDKDKDLRHIKHTLDIFSECMKEGVKLLKYEGNII